jgi:uncharacterized protein (TIGR02147 family)
MKIYEFNHYKAYVRAQIHALPNRGRGEMTRIAKALDIHTTMVTHVLKGKLQFTLEQTLKLAEHWGLNELETEYLVALVHLDRAGDQRAREYCRKRVEEVRTRALKLSIRLDSKNELSEADRAQFYSSWIYTYIRLLTAIGEYSTERALAEACGLPLATVRAALDFLLSRGLCVEKNGRIEYGPVGTYIEADSPLVASHHLNWRRKTSENFDRLRAEDLVFTYPVVMSESDFRIVRERLVQFIEEFKRTVSPSPAKGLYCLNFEWLKLKG